jgi:hypothetical protein
MRCTGDDAAVTPQEKKCLEEEELRKLNVGIEDWNGQTIHTFPIDPRRCQRLRWSIHPRHKGELIRLQCYAPIGHPERYHLFANPDNVNPKKWRE